MNLDLYEKAYVCGGPDRAARTALVSLHAAASVRIAGSPPHRVERVNRRAGHSIELALLNGLPNSGLPVRLAVGKLADSPELARCAAGLLDEKLLRRSLRGRVRPTRAGVELSERLTADVNDDGLVRFAVLGTLPEPLRPILTSLPPEAAFPIRVPKLAAGRSYDDRGDYNPPLRYGAP